MPCTQEVYYVYNERVQFPYIPGLTACTDPSTACTQEVYWVYTERVPSVYGCLIFQVWPRVFASTHDVSF